MSTLTNAADAVRSAEVTLRDLMQKAVSSGEYRDLPILARVAEQLNETTKRLEHPGASLTLQPEALRTVSGAKRVRSTSRASHIHKTRRRLSSPNGAYPKFFRADDKLVKVGWSKTDRSEYRHRVPRYVVRLALEAVSKMDSGKGPFTVDQLLPITDPNDHTEIATHQVYIALAWFKTEGIVMQHGRDGYTQLVKTDIDKLLEERWNSLSKAK